MNGRPMNGPDMPAAADLVLFNGHVITLDRDARIAQAVAILGNRIVGVGSSAEMLALALPGARRLDLRGQTMMPGLIDGHAHADREGLKQILPSLAGARSIADILALVAGAVARARPGEWVVMNPIGDPPEFAGIPGSLREGRMPTRWELDRVSPDNPVYIRAPWGYWPNKIPLLSCANSRALEAAGIDRDTVFPSPLVTIDRDPVSGEPNGVFLENTREPILEFTAMAAAPNFTHEQRVEALALSMETYNSVGTTSVFEGHGASADVIAAYQGLRNGGRQTLRAHLVLSPSWGGMGMDDIRAMLGSWAQWAGRRGLGDSWLRVADIYTEIDRSAESRMRVRRPVQTGWAGYSPDAGLEREAVLELMIEAARNDVRISGIWVNLLPLFAEVDKRIPLAGRRWVLGHQRVLDEDQIKLVKDLGIVLTTHTNRHIYKQGSAMRWRVGLGREHTIVPIRSLLDAGVPVAFGTDGLPPTLFMPIWQAVERIDRETGDVIGPSQRISRMEALRCATQGGAYLTFEENEKGMLAPGALADFIVLAEDPLSIDASRLPHLVPERTFVDGREVYTRAGAA